MGIYPFFTQYTSVITEVVMINNNKSAPAAGARKQLQDLVETKLTDKDNAIISHYNDSRKVFFETLLDHEVLELCGARYERIEQKNTCYRRHGHQ